MDSWFMNENIKTFRDKLKSVLINGGSINEYSDDLWSLENFQNLFHATDKNLKNGKGGFLSKISIQLNEAKKKNPNLTDIQEKVLLPLMIEVLSLYYVFPSNITKKRKKTALITLIETDNSLNLSLDSDFPISRDAISAGGIGSGGMGFNTNKQKEIFYLINVFKVWFEKSDVERKALFDNKDGGSNFRFQNFLDKVSEGKNPQCRHVLLHLLFPDYYEPIISSTQKWKITQVFSEFVSDQALKDECISEQAHQLTDQKIRVINKKLETLRGKKTNFYDKELNSFWDTNSSNCIPDLDTELLEYKKQIVLYGPPGTSKTYTAKQLASEIIRYRMAKDMGASILEHKGQKKLENALNINIHRLQLHPAYSYEDFIRGLQFKDGNTIYKSGYLLQLLDEMKKNHDLPHVLILDEINRVDLSRLFGECFSALENRGEAIDLLGMNNDQSIQLNIPDNLYIIGTMNLIDHSVEQLDFALRRRFLWVEASYNSEALFSICNTKWNDLNWENHSFTWESVESDFEKLVQAANNLNEVIQKEDELGSDFVLGHVFFIDAVPFLHQFLQPYSSSIKSFLYTSKDKWRAPVEKVWNLSLYPLLKEYLSGLDQATQTQIMKKLKDSFKP